MRLTALLGLAVVAVLAFAAVAIPLATPRRSTAPSLPPVAASAEDGTTGPIAVVGPSSLTDSQPAANATSDETQSPDASGAVVAGTTPPDSGGDWYKKLNVSYTETIKGGNTGRVTVAGIGTGVCTVDFTYDSPLPGSGLDGAAGYSIGPDVADPWQGGFDVAETYVGGLSVRLTCYSSGWHRGYSHTYRLPVRVLPADPWIIQGTMSGYVGEELEFSYSVNDPNFSSVMGWRDGSCALTVNVPGLAPVVATGLYWHNGMHFDHSVTAIPTDAPGGTVTWSIVCTDGGPGWPASLTTTASASGSYELGPRPTAAPPTATATPEPSAGPSPTPTPTPPPDPTPGPTPSPVPDPTPTP